MHGSGLNEVVKLLLNHVVSFLRDRIAVRSENGAFDVKVVQLGANLAMENGEERIALQAGDHHGAVLRQRRSLAIGTPRVDSAADSIAGLHDGDFEAEVFQLARSGQSGQAGAHYHDVLLLAHVRRSVDGDVPEIHVAAAVEELDQLHHVVLIEGQVAAAVECGEHGAHDQVSSRIGEPELKDAISQLQMQIFQGLQ